MRKDFLQTDEEKQRRQQRLDENRSSTLQRISTSSSSNLQSSPPNLDHIDQVCSFNSLSILFNPFLVVIKYE